MPFDVPRPLKTIRQLWDYIKPLGVWRGSVIHRRLHTGSGVKLVKVRGYHEPFSLRANTADVVIFERLILKEDYRLNLTHPIRRIIDAGSNIGLSVNYFAKQFPTAEIAAIEPEASNYELLVANTSWNPRVRCFHQAIWSKSEPVRIRDAKAPSHAFQVESKSVAIASSECEVRGVDIGTLMKELGWEQVDLLKMDIEGAESEVFLQEPAWLAKVKVLVIEIHEHLARGATLGVYKAAADFKTAFRQGELDVFIR